jgi:uncharacterized protein (TIGR02271 family)
MMTHVSQNQRYKQHHYSPLYGCIIELSLERSIEMTTTNRSTVMTAFADNTQAQQAISDLQQAGFGPDQIRYSERRSGTPITDSLENLGVPEQEATFYNREFEAGRTVVMVSTTDRRQEAYDILRRRGGYDFNSQATQTGSDGPTTNTEREEGERRLKLHEEQLRVQKQPLERGEARLRKDVVSEQRDVDVPVMHEEVYLERRPGFGQPADQPIGEGETYRVPVREEQVTVEKQPIVREEVALGKRPVQENKRVSETVSREQAHVERSGDVDIQGTDRDTRLD